MADRSDDAVLTHGTCSGAFLRSTSEAGRGKTATRQTDVPTVAMNVEKNCSSLPKDATQACSAQRAATTPYCLSRLTPAMSVHGALIVSRPSVARAWPRHQGWMSSKITAQFSGCPLSGPYPEQRAIHHASGGFSREAGWPWSHGTTTLCSGWTAEQVGDTPSSSLGLDKERVRPDPGCGWSGFLLSLHRNGVLSAIVRRWCEHAYDRSDIRGRLALDPTAERLIDAGGVPSERLPAA
jgi:hypothetical protein